jgi:hypothetical protein
VQALRLLLDCYVLGRPHLFRASTAPAQALLNTTSSQGTHTPPTADAFPRQTKQRRSRPQGRGIRDTRIEFFQV